jgi:uncharacterized protein YcbK (DUF882 family)
MAVSTQLDQLRAGGILNPEVVIEEAKREGVRLSLACALLEKESAGGKNVFGHDRGTIFAGAGTVTRDKYTDYKRQRDANPRNRRMQGVGPAQLTWWELQNQADAEGGCWQPRYNIRIGLRHLDDLMRRHGEPDGIRRYNGEGSAAEAYSRDVRARARRWHEILAGARPPAKAVVLRRGAEGDAVVKLTRRLAFVKSAKTRKPYLDAKRARFDEEAELALKAFQRQHGLRGTGVADAETLRKLDRSVRAEKARRRRRDEPAKRPDPGGKPVPAPPKPTLAELVTLFERRDAATDQAWNQLVIYGDRLRLAAVSEKARPRPPKDPGVVAPVDEPQPDELTRILQRIEQKLGTLVVIEQHENELLEARGPAAELPEGPAMPALPEVAASVPAAPEAVVAVTAPTAVAVAEALAPTAPKRRALTELDPAELVRRIALLDRMAKRARAELLERYEDVEAELAALHPRRPQKTKDRKPVPAHNGGGGAAHPAKPQREDTRPDRGGTQGGKSVVTKRGDSGQLVRRSKLAIASYLKAKGDPDLELRKRLRRDARVRGRRNVATATWEAGVRAAQKCAGRPVDGELDGELMQILHAYWPRDSTAKRAVRSTPAWRAIPGQLTRNFNVKEFACKDSAHTGYIPGLMREQGLSKAEARERAKGLARRLETLRKLGGNRPLVITSAYRTKAYNASLTGSATNSAHTRGYAVDTPPPRGVSLDQHRAHALKAFECGVGYYPKNRGYFIHCDFDKTLGGRRTW